MGVAMEVELAFAKLAPQQTGCRERHDDQRNTGLPIHAVSIAGSVLLANGVFGLRRRTKRRRRFRAGEGFRVKKAFVRAKAVSRYARHRSPNRLVSATPPRSKSGFVEREFALPYLGLPIELFRQTPTLSRRERNRFYSSTPCDLR
jgi:hypothetical protein